MNNVDFARIFMAVSLFLQEVSTF